MHQNWLFPICEHCNLSFFLLLLIKFKNGVCFFYLHLGSCLQMRMEWVEEWRKCYGSSSKVISLASSTRQLHLASDVFIIIPGEHNKRLWSLPNLFGPCLPERIVSPCLLERIELFTEGQAFLRVVCFGVPPPHLPVSKMSLFLSLSVFRQSSLLTRNGRGGRGWAVELSHTTARELGPQ